MPKHLFSCTLHYHVHRGKNKNTRNQIKTSSPNYKKKQQGKGNRRQNTATCLWEFLKNANFIRTENNNLVYILPQNHF